MFAASINATLVENIFRRLIYSLNEYFSVKDPDTCVWCCTKIKMPTKPKLCLCLNGLFHSPNAVLRLRFNHFATECSWDHMYIYDGDSIYAPLVAVFR